MSTCCRIIIHSPRSAIEPILLDTFDAAAIIPVADAKPGDFFLSEGNDAVALDEYAAISFFPSVAHEPELLAGLSRRCNTKVSAIAVQSGVGFVSILVVDRGTIVRRYSKCSEVGIEIDEGEIPGWEDRIRGHAWSAADEIVGFHPPTPEPSAIGTAIRRLGRSIGLISKDQPEYPRVVTPSGLLFA